MNKDQIIAFIVKWGFTYKVLSSKMGIGQKSFSDKINGKYGQSLNDNNIAKLNEVLKEMRVDLAGL